MKANAGREGSVKSYSSENSRTLWAFTGEEENGSPCSLSLQESCVIFNRIKAAVAQSSTPVWAA